MKMFHLSMDNTINSRADPLWLQFAIETMITIKNNLQNEFNRVTVTLNNPQISESTVNFGTT